MGFYEELTGKIAEVREAAEQAFVERYSEWSLTLGPGGRLEQIGAPGSDGRPGHEVLGSDEPVRQEWEAFRRSVIDLQARLDTYLDMGHYGIAPMSRYREELGGVAAGAASLGGEATVFGFVRTAEDYLMDVRDLVTEEEWTGPAAADFQLALGDPLQLALVLQKAYVQELNISLNCLWQVVEQTRIDILKIVDAVIGAFRGPDVSLTDVLNLISIGTTAAGLALGGGPVALTLGTVSLTSGLGSTLLGGQDSYTADEWAVERIFDAIGLVVQEVVASADDALDRLDTRIAEYDRQLSAAMDLNRIPAGPPPPLDILGYDPAHPNRELALSSPCIKVAQPTVTTGESFGEYTGNLTVELEDLRAAGTDKLPVAADQLDSAAVYVRGMVLPTWLTRFFPGFKASWEGCATDLATVFGEAGSRFRESGTALLDIAENYRSSDDRAAQGVQAVGLPS
jgi:hypothetical protein